MAEMPARRRQQTTSLPGMGGPQQVASDPAAPTSDGDGIPTYAGARKMTVTTRIYPPLWEAYEAHTVALQAWRRRTTRAELVNAVLHLHLPRSAEEARALLERFHAELRAAPPADF
jgi:hypothetical protein